MSDSVKIRITGLPDDMTLPILANEFRTIFRKIYVKKFWIESLCNMDGGLKQMIVVLKYRADAHRTQNFLHSKPFVYNMIKYPLVVENVEESTDLPENSERKERRDNNCRKEVTRSRSRSPVVGREARHDEHRNRPQGLDTSYNPHHNEKVYRSSNTRVSPDDSRNSRYPDTSRHSRYPTGRSKYPDNLRNSKYPPDRSRYSRYSPVRSRNSRYPPDCVRNPLDRTPEELVKYSQRSRYSSRRYSLDRRNLTEYSSRNSSHSSRR